MLDSSQEVGEFLKRVGDSRRGAPTKFRYYAWAGRVDVFKGNRASYRGVGCVGGLVYPERTRPDTHTHKCCNRHTRVMDKGRE